MNNSAVVFDASAALSFAFQDEIYHLQTMALIADLEKRSSIIHAPSMFAYECDSVVRLKAYAGKVSESKAEEARQLIAALGANIIYDASIMQRAYEIATEYGQPRTYDATYAAFAQIRRLDLWTADKRFYNAVKSGLKFVKFVGTYR